MSARGTVPTVGHMIEATELTKRYGGRTAVDALTFRVRPGRVTGFLGPNGAGKSTTMRLVLGLDTATSGTATVCGGPYRRLGAPLRSVGALLDAKGVHGGRSAYGHLAALAASNGIPRAAWRRCWTWSVSRPRPPVGARRASPSAWASGWASPP